PGTSAAERAAIARRAGARSARKLPGGAYRLRVAGGRSVGAVVAELRRDERVASATPNYVARAAAFYPNDPGLGGLGEWQRLQWNFAGPWGVRAPDAWELARLYGAPG